MKQYSLADELIRPLLRVAMPWAPRLHVPGNTARGVRCRFNDKENVPGDYRERHAVGILSLKGIVPVAEW